LQSRFFIFKSILFKLLNSYTSYVLLQLLQYLALKDIELVIPFNIFTDVLINRKLIPKFIFRLLILSPILRSLSIQIHKKDIPWH